MATVEEHYEKVLSDVYAWMFGGIESGIKMNASFFQKHGIKPARSGMAVDLGAGCGFQSIPLSQIGYSVTAIDLDSNLLNELAKNSCRSNIKVVRDDLVNFDVHINENPELIICMTDTIVHLESKNRVISLFEKVVVSLEDSGQFIITFRDLSYELSELERFMPVKSDDNIIFTCFLEYEPETVKVHDLVYRKEGGRWNLNKSYYRKLRLSKEWVDTQLSRVGFTQIRSAIDKGVVTVIATK
ncbi:class I SAM-dependent methyltransferase [Imhoffiella purpurea]|uniref:class I SAM-dependent methyltransferase n=1 Tax=Imhoffiella purpurea TaxID=1249627 RepID=UPI0005C24854|nr:class I SAM-dependent methyltransferase [Imhoffiella purpurea]